MRHVGISLSNELDSLWWDFGIGDGNISVAQAYSAMASEAVPITKDWWHSLIWKWKIPGKIRLFIWLALNSKIITGDRFCLHGVIGPSVYYLCLRAEESYDHLFAKCSYTHQLWEEVSMLFAQQGRWRGNTLSECLKGWYSRYKSVMHFPVSFIWGVWRLCNSILFEQKAYSFINSVVYIKGYKTGMVWKTKPPKAGIRCALVIDSTVHVGFFDGATQLGRGGAGCYIRLDKD